MSSAPITMSLMGGLGNQLFQLAAGLEVALRRTAPLRLDLSWFDQSLRRAPGGLVLRPYELEGIADDIPKVKAPRGRAHEVIRHGRDVVVRRSSRLVNRVPGPFFVESSVDFDPRALDVGPGTHMWGYFASWRYFPTVADSVRARALDAPGISSWAHGMSAEATSKQAIALHVRRGDYLTLASTYGHVSPDFYRRSLSLLRQMGQEGPVWLFSDDPPGARTFLSGIPIDHVVEPPRDTTSLDSMVAMSGARALVIANSTYSWWAAFLRDAPGRPIVAPRPTWARPGLPEPRDSLLPDWLTVDCR
jgi:hypothetical protein